MNKIILINDHLLWPVVAGALILLVVFIWKEFALSGRTRLIFKVLLSIFAITALALIALKPAIRTKESGGKMVLLTSGYEKTKLDSLKKNFRKLKVLEYDPKEPISEDILAAEVVYIMGHGIREYDLPQFENIPAIHLPGKLPEGIVKVKFPEKFLVGDDLEIDGLYRNPRQGNLLVLQGQGGISLDSVVLNEGDEQSFQLATELKATGNFVYSLIEKNTAGQVLTQDPVPIQVGEKVDLKILILNNFPTFETKYLKNFLAEAGHELVVRSQITRGRFKYEYFNTDRTKLGSLSRETLKPYDLLILDAVSLRSLENIQSGAIENAIREDGLGVFVQPDEAFFNSPGSLIDIKFQRQINNEVKLGEWPTVPIPKFPFTIISAQGIESIYVESNSIIAAYKKIGQGRIGITVLSKTWELVLEGNTETYRSIWSRMIEQVSKREDDSVQFQQQDRFVSPQEPFHFKIRTKTEDLEITNNGRIIPVAQDINFSDQWTGTIWPREQGWQELQDDTTSVFTYYVSKEDSWGSLTAVHTRENNQRYFERAFIKGNGQWPLEPINSLWFYVMFLICMGGLWLEPKLG